MRKIIDPVGNRSVGVEDQPKKQLIPQIGKDTEARRGKQEVKRAVSGPTCNQREFQRQEKGYLPRPQKKISLSSAEFERGDEVSWCSLKQN